MATITQQYVIHSAAGNVWQALVDNEVIERWGGGPARMTAEVGAKWELWDGDIWGTNLEVVPQRKLVQEWWGGEWQQPSVVTFTLTERDGATVLDLVHENVPDDEQQSIDDGWHSYYLDPLKRLLEE